MKMKYAVGAMIVIFLIFMGLVFTWGFVQKQLRENEDSSNSQSTNQDSTSSPTTTQPNPDTSTQKTFTVAEVALHKKMNDCWIIINNKVYDVGSFLEEHPGGADLIVPFCGKDASQAFSTKGGKNNTHSQTAQNSLQQYLLGILQ